MEDHTTKAILETSLDICKGAYKLINWTIQSTFFLPTQMRKVSDQLLLLQIAGGTWAGGYTIYASAISKIQNSNEFSTLHAIPFITILASGIYEAVRHKKKKLMENRLESITKED